jgi:SAM-dependent methyltransferase
MDPIVHMAPSEFVMTWSSKIAAGGHVLDLACGRGRHTQSLLARGFRVTAVDIDTTNIETLMGSGPLNVIQADLEHDNPWPLTDQFDGIIVANYLYRPLFHHLLNALTTNGVLIYETFMTGNEKFGKPSNPAFLLEEGELLKVYAGALEVLAFKQGYRATPTPAMVQAFCGRNKRLMMPAGSPP